MKEGNLDYEGWKTADPGFECCLNLNELTRSLIPLGLSTRMEDRVPFNRYEAVESQAILRTRITKHFGLDEDFLLFEAGAAGGLRLCFQKCAIENRSLWLPPPSYNGFRQIVDITGCRSHYYPTLDAGMDIQEVPVPEVPN